MDPKTTTPSAEDEAAANAAAEAGFSEGFDGDRAEQAPPPEPKDTAPAAKPAKAPKESAAAPAAPKPEEDPYAGLSKDVRDQLAQLSVMKHQLASAHGRLTAFELEKRERDQRSAAGPAPANQPEPKPKTVKRDARDRVKGELPEVDEAISEATDELRDQVRNLESQIAALKAPATTTPAPLPASASKSVDEDEALLDELHPKWAETVTGSDFELWLSRQDAAYATKVRTSPKAAVLADALSRFEVFRQRQADKATAEAEAKRQRDLELQNRQHRARGAAPPPRTGAKPEPSESTPDAQAEFERGFAGAG